MEVVLLIEFCSKIRYHFFRHDTLRYFHPNLNFSVCNLLLIELYLHALKS
jgi:hypothetical protein